MDQVEKHEVMYSRRDLMLWTMVVVALVTGLLGFVISLVALSNSSSSNHNNALPYLGNVVLDKKI